MHPPTNSADSAFTGSSSWKWSVCGLLLMASAINYMDRQTLANASVRITKEFSLTQKQYGDVEAVFGYAFAAGSIFFGWFADRFPIRWLYPTVLALWSVAGFATGFAGSYDDLLYCRMALGFFEAGHWPCGVRTTRMLLDPRSRSMGNSVLQSGTSIGAIITPLLMKSLMTSDLGSWRIAFKVIGLIGFGWIAVWFAFVRRDSVMDRSAAKAEGRSEPGDSIWRILVSRRMLVVFFVVACINTTWQILRAWMPKYLQEGRNFTEDQSLYFNAAWFAATDVGCILAGAMVIWISRSGASVHRARLLVFAGCGALCALTAFVPMLPRNWLLLAILMTIGAGALGVFPIYHAFTQDISARHQGKITGLAGVAAWIAPSFAQSLFGWYADRSGSFDAGFALAGFLPLIAAIPLWLCWNQPENSK